MAKNKHRKSMNIFPTKQLILEGPDLVGKTTLYNEIHKTTGFKWNIQDRSTLSMLVYARLYDRNVSIHRARLQDEINDLNNRVIVLLPPFDVIVDRYHDRGDEFQDLQSLKQLYEIFSEEAQLIQKRPTVMCIREALDVETILNYISEWSYAIETCRPYHVGEVIRDTLHADIKDELTLTIKLQYQLEQPDFEILNNKLEGEYYKKIKQNLCETIHNEINGLNPYKIPQDLNSRRFFYHSDTCIAGLHFMPRGSVLKVVASLRSTDVDRNASVDLQFLEFLTHFINQKFDFNCNVSHLNVVLNSAHIRRDLED